MNNCITIENTKLAIKEWKHQRVVTFKDIDEVHQRPEGTARDRFNDNRERFIEGEDYFILKPKDLKNTEMGEIHSSGIFDLNPRGTTFLTESGYMMLVKSFNDDLAWKVQRQLVNVYFSVKDMIDKGELVYKKDLDEIIQSIVDFKEQINIRIAYLESGVSDPSGRKSEWIQETSRDVLELAEYLSISPKEMYSRILDRMDEIYGTDFKNSYKEYLACHSNEKSVWRIMVVEYYGLQTEFEDAMIQIGRECGLYQKNSLANMNCFEVITEEDW